MLVVLPQVLLAKRMVAVQRSLEASPAAERNAPLLVPWALDAAAFMVHPLASRPRPAPAPGGGGVMGTINHNVPPAWSSCCTEQYKAISEALSCLLLLEKGGRGVTGGDK